MHSQDAVRERLVTHGEGARLTFRSDLFQEES